jgi:hypothetical protein
MSATAGVRVKETVERRAELGIHCVDAIDGRTALGLRARVRRAVAGARRVPMQANRSGLLVAHGLPGLAPWSLAATEGPPPAQAFAVRVDDPAGRFFPAVFDVQAPSAGLAVPDCLGPARALPLFSRPTRPPSTGLAVVRAALRRLPAGPLHAAALATAAPAAWALVDVFLAREAPAAPLPLGTGLADARGELQLLFSAPEPPAADGAPRSPFDHQWPLLLSVRDGALTPVAPEPGDTLADEPIPPYCALLAQPARPVLVALAPPAADAAAPLVPNPAARLPLTLHFGRPATATTPGHRVLYVSHA